MNTKILKPILIFFTFITMFFNIKVLAAPDTTTGPDLPISEIRNQHKLFRQVTEGGFSDRKKITLDGKEFLLTVVIASHQFLHKNQFGATSNPSTTFDGFLENAFHHEVTLKKEVRERTLTDKSKGISAIYNYQIANALNSNLLQIILQSYDPENC